MTLTITHTAADGTLLEGTVKGDGALDAIRAAGWRCKGWRYFPSIRAIGISHSRDRAPKLALIDAAADVLREAGFTVELDIEGGPRAMDDAEADRADRMDDRADALAAKSARKGAEAEARYAAAHEIADMIPAGQPVLVGHHSERGHRRDLKRMDGHMRKSVEAAREADAAAHLAETAARHMEARNNPRRVYRRIRTQEADLRKIERELTPCRTSGRKLKPEAEGRSLDCPVCYSTIVIGAELVVPEHGAASGRRAEELHGRKAHLEESIRYWKEALDAAKAAGADVPADTADIKPGYWVRSWAGWKEVKRVNKVTVTVRDSWDNPNNPEPRYFDRKLTLDDIREIRETSPFEPAPVQDLDAELAALDAADAAKANAVTETHPDHQPEPGEWDPWASRRGTVSDAALAVLTAAGATEQTIHLAGVPSSREAFEEADRVLRALPGFQRYDSGQRAYVYSRDPRRELQDITGVEPVRPASGAADKALSYYATPADVARRMVAELGALPRHARVLEPSAGDGALVRAVRQAHPGAYVDAVETDLGRVRLLGRTAGEFVTVYCARFQDWAGGESVTGAAHPAPVPYHAVVMNPPFTERDDRQAWATHFRLAWDMLAEGGRMVAILPASYRFAETRAAREVRALVEANGGTVEDLPDTTFAGGGTRVRTVLVTATRTV